MGDLFDIYFSIGVEHILDTQGVDHILFIITLAAIYSFWDIKKVLVLATAFTIGHSVTLALSVLEFVSFPSDLVEFAIPLTIIITAMSNLVRGVEKPENKRISKNYYFALFFGLIHGMGFSGYLKSILGQQDNVVMELLWFNLGLEVGQIVILAVFMTIGYLLQRIIHLKRRDWNIGISSAAIGMSLLLIINMS